MLLDFDPTSILEESSLGSVEITLFGYAEQLAVLGAIDAARELTALFYQRSTTGHYYHYFARLAFAWNETGKWPTQIPQKARSQEHLDGLRDSYEKQWGGIYESIALPENMQTCGEEVLKACLDFENRTSHSPLGSPYDNDHAVNERLVKALDIAIHLSRELEHLSATTSKESDADAVEDATNPSLDAGWMDLHYIDQRSADILNRILKRWDVACQVEALTQAERLWPLFVSGAVARAAGWNGPELDAKVKVIVDTFTQRLDEPYARTVLSDKSLKRMLDIADEITTKGTAAAVHFTEMGDFDDEHDNRPKTLFKPPASEKHLATLERRLDCTLPDDYKAFLHISNGFSYDVSDSGYRSGFFSGIIPKPALHPHEDLYWDEDDVWELPLELLRIPREIEQLGNWETNKTGKGHSKWSTALPLINRVLQIGVRGIDNLWLISPDQVAGARQAYATMYERGNAEQKAVIDRAVDAFAGSWEAFEKVEWACVNWTSGGAARFTSYPSFTRYLEINVAAGMKSRED